MMIDCDQLKSIDSTHGADVRDQVMKELAQSVRKFTRMREIGTEAGRPSDYVIRFGTQQILVILEKTHASRAMLVAKRLSRIIGRKADWLGGISTLSVSVGVSTYPEDATDVSELISNTTLALRYAQTQLGLNAVCHSSQVPKNFLSSEEALINPVQVPNVVIESIPVASNIGCEVIVDRRKSERRKRPLKG
jgi:diguanylate cyclase (GGDEF)-like protein